MRKKINKREFGEKKRGREKEREREREDILIKVVLKYYDIYKI